MSSMTIVEYVGLASAANAAAALSVGAFPIPIPQQPPTAVQTVVTLTSSSQQSAAFAAGTGLVEFTTDTSIHVLVGSNPTATTACTRYGASADPYYLAVVPGQKLAVRTP